MRRNRIRYFTAPAEGEGGAGAGAAGNDGGAEDGVEAFKAITSQDDLNKIINDRLTRERSKYADYKDLKTKAAEFDKIAEANKSEIQKAAEAKAAAEQERDQARAEALRLRIAAKHQISDEDADLFLTGTDEETLTKQAQRLSQRVEDRKKQGNRVPGEGNNPNNGTSSGGMREFTRQLFDAD